MATRFSCILLFVPLMTSPAVAKAIFESLDVEVHHVVTDDRKIVMIVSGQCTFALSPSENPEGFSQRIETTMVNAVIMIERMDLPGSGYERWSEHAQRAEALLGQRAIIQLADAHITIDSGMVQLVRSRASSFGPVQAPPASNEE
jgi:hypothetical protein